MKKLLNCFGFYFEFSPKIKIKVKHDWFGTEYGGFYICTELSMSSESVVYSFGVGEDISFDEAIIKKYGCQVYAFDPTPKSIKWINSQKIPDKFLMFGYGIADFDGNVSFNPPINPNHVSHTMLDRAETKSRAIELPVKKLSTIMKELGHLHIDILKMDIEGAEYGVIKNMSNSDIRPNQILVEYHHRFPGVGLQKTKDSIKIIKKMGYIIFYVSESKEEYCFIKKDLLKRRKRNDKA